MLHATGMLPATITFKVIVCNIGKSFCKELNNSDLRVWLQIRTDQIHVARIRVNGTNICGWRVIFIAIITKMYQYIFYIFPSPSLYPNRSDDYAYDRSCVSGGLISTLQKAMPIEKLRVRNGRFIVYYTISIIQYIVAVFFF